MTAVNPASPATDIRADRRLLLPGPIPPLSHLGATLFRHSAHAALRYAFYQLGQPPPEAPAIRFVSLRPYFDAPKLEPDEDRGGSAEIFGALIDPGGVAEQPLPKTLRGTLWFHRIRLGLGIAARRRRQPHRGASRPGSTELVSARISELLPRLGDAVLGELLATLARRRHRARGQSVGLAQSRAAARFLEGEPTDLDRLGLPDPRVASWRGDPPSPPPETSVRAALAQPAHRLRGGFREQYRWTLDQLRPDLLELGKRAARRGLVDSADDVFFLPLDLLGDLEGDSPPDWLEGAIASNRAEWEGLVDHHPPADTLGNVAAVARVDLPAHLAPLTPLA